MLDISEVAAMVLSRLAPHAARKASPAQIAAIAWDYAEAWEAESALRMARRSTRLVNTAEQRPAGPTTSASRAAAAAIQRPAGQPPVPPWTPSFDPPPRRAPTPDSRITSYPPPGMPGPLLQGEQVDLDAIIRLRPSWGVPPSETIWSDGLGVEVQLDDAVDEEFERTEYEETVQPSQPSNRPIFGSGR